MNAPFPFHCEGSAILAAPAETVFAMLDDHRRLASHMEKPSPMLAGASMVIETDAQKGQALGSVIQMHGHVLGLSLHVAERVTRYEPPHAKTWQTFGETRLLVIGAYAMGFELTPHGDTCTLRVWLDYNLPQRAWQRVLAWACARRYARWCVGRMVEDAVSGVTAPTGGGCRAGPGSA